LILANIITVKAYGEVRRWMFVDLDFADEVTSWSTG